MNLTKKRIKKIKIFPTCQINPLVIVGERKKELSWPRITLYLPQKTMVNRIVNL